MVPNSGHPKKGRPSHPIPSGKKEGTCPSVEVRRIDDYETRVIQRLNEAGCPPLSFQEECDRLHAMEEQLYNANLRRRFLPGQHNIRTIDATLHPSIYWFIGDIHGDLCALKTVFSFIEAEMIRYPHCRPVLVFLGDIIDRGAYAREVLDFILDLYENHRQYDVLYLKGNHDEGLSLLESGHYYSDVIPDDFVQELNKRIDQNEPWYTLPGYAAIRFFQEAATAIILKYGKKAALCTHGGVPHIDVQDLWKKSPHSLENLSRAPKLEALFLRDFVWNRFHPLVKKIPPNRKTSHTLMGYGDFEEFCKLFRKKTGLYLSLMVRGHDHVPLGYKDYPTYGPHTLITATTMCANHVFPERRPSVVRWIPGEKVKIYALNPPSLFLSPDQVYYSHDKI